MDKEILRSKSRFGLKSKTRSTKVRQDVRRKVKRLPYLLIPKGKRLRKNVIAKLERENFHHTIAKAVDLAKKYQNFSVVDKDEETLLEREEKLWRDAQTDPVKEAEIDDWRIARLRARERKRKELLEMKEREELARRKYRVDPRDRNVKYITGYEKRRHRITKERFMRCIDVLMFKEVLERSSELRGSPIWDEDLNFQNVTFTEARMLKEHLEQFEVIVEALKQGIFDKPGCGDIPLRKVRRKRNSQSEVTRRSYRYSKFAPDIVENKERKKLSTIKERSEKVRKRRRLKRQLSFPPYLPGSGGEDNEEKKKRWLAKVQSWLQRSTQKVAPEVARPSQIEQSNEVTSLPQSAPIEVEILPEVTPTEGVDDKYQKDLGDEGLTKTHQTRFPPELGTHKSEVATSTAKKMDETREATHGLDEHDSLIHAQLSTNEYGSLNRNPYSNYLTLKVPVDLEQRKKFIHALVEKRDKQKSLKDLHQLEREEYAKTQRQREMWYTSNQEPLQMLHPDEVDSDLWSMTTTTTTDSYASWRGLPDLTQASKKMENLASPIDDTLAWRFILLLFVLWEIGVYVGKRIDDVYYNIFTFYLYRENIWQEWPGIFAKIDGSMFLPVMEYFHLFASIVSLSIVYRRNECVSLLFAFSLMMDGFVKTAIGSYDAIYFPKPLSWSGVALHGVHLIWRSFAVCLFVAYHYYSAGYIRKAREFKHRKTKLHNHEIYVKGTKGLLKRRLAWNWMIRHARDTNLRKLKKKYPLVKDGHFPDDKLQEDINFLEAKELRLYAQQHNLNIGYPYNRLRDMRRYVFGELEKSDYTDQDEDEKTLIQEKRRTALGRRTIKAITVDKWQQWKQNDREGRKQSVLRKMTAGAEKTNNSVD